MTLTQQEKKDFQTFVIKYTIIGTSVAFILGQTVKEFIVILADTLTNPFFSVDLDNNGKPDLKELNSYATRLFGFKFPLGNLIMSLIKIAITFFVIYWLVKFLINYTNLVKL